MNAPLLRKVQAAILEEPKRIDMSDWVYLDNKSPMAPACGTVGCIAGWTVLLNHEPDPNKAQRTVYDLHLNEPMVFSDDVLDDATLMLGGLGDEDVDWGELFYVLGWPQQFQARLGNTMSRTPEYAQVVSDYIDYFIAKYEVPA